ncbi:MAG: ATP-binding cassette domain-containing protein [Patescibacteria group bacterium]
MHQGPIVVFKFVSKSYGVIKAISDIDFSINKGEFVYLTGASGAGKTTILKLILGETKPTTGHVFFDGQDLALAKAKEIPFIRQNIGVVFQDFKILGERTAKENIEVALAVKGVKELEWSERIKHVLKLVGISRRSTAFPAQLSGGELQRLSLARAVALAPKIVLADEPTGNLDWETATSIVELLHKINKEGITIIMATHNRVIIDKMKRRTIVLKDGKLVSDSGKK